MSDHQPDSQPDIAGSISNKDGASDNKPARQRKPKRPAYYSLFQLPNALVRKQPELYTLSTPPGTAPTKITYAPSDPFSRRLNRWKRSIERGGAFKNKRRLDHEVLGSRFRSERVGDVRTKGRVLLNGRLYLPTPRSALKFKLVARRFKGFVEHWLESAPERSLPLPTLSGSMLRGQDWVEPNRRMMVDGRASKNPAGYPKLRAQMAARKAAAAAAAAGEAAAGAEAGNSNGNQDDRHADTDADADNESSSQSETDEDSKPIADVNDTEAMPVEQKYPKYYRHHHLLWREDPFNEDTGRFEDGHPILNITFDQATAKHFDKPFVRHTESMNVASVRNALRSGRKTQQTEFAKSRFELPSSDLLDAIHHAASDLYTRTKAPHMMYDFSPESLLAMGILMQELMRDKFPAANGRVLTEEQCSLGPCLSDIADTSKGFKPLSTVPSDHMLSSEYLVSRRPFTTQRDEGEWLGPGTFDF